MRIGILTYHRSINYGAVMQSFALSRRLSEVEDVDVEIIDYMSRKMDIYYKLFTIYRGKNSILHFDDRLKMYRAINYGIKQLPLSTERLVSDDLRKFTKYIDSKYDVIVVGSDAVWNYEKRGLPNPYFLIGVNGVKKFSYAASCNGINVDQLTDKKKSILKESFDGFDYIGVRDKLTKYVVDKTSGSNRAIHTCDPTFLLDFDRDGLDKRFTEKLLEKLEQKYGWDVSKKHIGLMLSNYNGNLSEVLINNIRKRYGNSYQIVSLYSYCKFADIPYIADLTPFEWSRIFSLFDITFSKYFHGTLLSILNYTPVISLSAEKETAGIPAKVEDVLDRLDLMEFYHPAKSAYDIDWNTFMETVNSLIVEPPVEKMKAGISKERQTAQGFFDTIKGL